MFFVFGDESGIVFQVEGETVALRHGGSLGGGIMVHEAVGSGE